MTLHAGGLGNATSVSSAAFPLLAPAGTAAAPSYSFSGTTDGFSSIVPTLTVFSVGGVGTFMYGPVSTLMQQQMASNVAIAWSTTTVNGVNDVILQRASTATLGLTGGLQISAAAITAGTGTGLTVNDAGSVRHVTYKVTLTFAGLSAAALTADHTIATLPAKSKITAFYADTTTKYIGGSVSACALKVGTAVAGAEVLASHDVFAAAITKGLADADMGTAMTRAASIQGGYMPSFTGTTIISVRITTVTANTNALTQGSTTFYIETEVLP